MALTLKVGNRDLSESLRVAHDDGLDPANPTYTEPEFSGSPAFADGQAFAGDAVNNRQGAFPLLLQASTVDALYQLIREINLELVSGVVVEYRSGSASQSTFFVLERGRLEPKYEHWLDNSAKTRATLNLWMRPYGNTGTSRLLASAAITAPTLLTATGVQGDVDAEGTLRVQFASSAQFKSNGAPFVIYGTKYPVASGWSPIYTASQLASAGFTATTVGASGRMASVYRAWNVSPTSTLPEWLYRIPIRRQDPGRYRAIGLMRHFIGGGTISRQQSHLSVYLVEETANVELPPVLHTAPVSEILASSWNLVDLGEITNPRVNGYVYVAYTGASGASALATYPVQFDGVALVPIDRNAGIMINSLRSTKKADAWKFELSAPSKMVGVRAASITAEAASQIIDDVADQLRGDYPAIAPVGSPGASGAAQMLVWAGIKSVASDLSNVRGNEPLTVDLSVRERFTYLR